MKKNELKILDCTLRDGGYYNNWDFSSELIEDYFKAMVAAKVEYVELGFRFLKKDIYLGPCAYTTSSFLETLSIPKKLKIGIMINAKDIVSNNLSKNSVVTPGLILSVNISRVLAAKLPAILIFSNFSK